MDVGGAAGQLDAVHLGHDDIGEEQRERLLAQAVEGLAAVGEARHLVAGLDEGALDEGRMESSSSASRMRRAGRWEGLAVMIGSGGGALGGHGGSLAGALGGADWGDLGAGGLLRLRRGFGIMIRSRLRKMQVRSQFGHPLDGCRSGHCGGACPARRTKLRRVALPGKSGVNLMNAPELQRLHRQRTAGIRNRRETCQRREHRRDVRRRTQRDTGGTGQDRSSSRYPASGSAASVPPVSRQCPASPRDAPASVRPGLSPCPAPCPAPPPAPGSQPCPRRHLLRRMDSACAAWQSGTGTRAPGAMRALSDSRPKL